MVALHSQAKVDEMGRHDVLSSSLPGIHDACCTVIGQMLIGYQAMSKILHEDPSHKWDIVLVNWWQSHGAPHPPSVTWVCLEITLLASPSHVLRVWALLLTEASKCFPQHYYKGLIMPLWKRKNSFWLKCQLCFHVSRWSSSTFWFPEACFSSTHTHTHTHYLIFYKIVFN